MSTVAFIRRCLAAGMTLDLAMSAAEAFEAEVALLPAPRSKGAIRQERYRASHPSQSVTGDDSDAKRNDPHVGTSAQVVTPSLPSLRSEEVVVVGVERERAPESSSPEDWPAGDAREHARLIVEAVASPWLDPTKSLDLNTTAGRLVAWRKAGASWEHDVMAVIAGVCAKRRSRVASWKYFDEAVANSIADNRAALQIPEASGVRATGPPGITDRIAAEHAEARRRALAN